MNYFHQDMRWQAAVHTCFCSLLPSHTIRYSVTATLPCSFLNVAENGCHVFPPAGDANPNWTQLRTNLWTKQTNQTSSLKVAGETLTTELCKATKTLNTTNTKITFSSFVVSNWACWHIFYWTVSHRSHF